MDWHCAGHRREAGRREEIRVMVCIYIKFWDRLQLQEESRKASELRDGKIFMKQMGFNES